VFSTLYSECGNKRAGESVPSIVVEDARGAGKNNLLKTPALTQKISPLQDLPMDSDNLTNHARPTTDAILTVRCIKSFEYRTCKNLVLRHLNLEILTIGELKDLIKQRMSIVREILRYTSKKTH
jgi:hypothetical protein